MSPAREDAEVEAMASTLTPEEVEANNTLLVLMRHGWLCREIAPLIDRVEQAVRSRAAMIAAGIVALPSSVSAETVAATGYSASQVAMIGAICLCIGATVGVLFAGLFWAGKDRP